MAPIREIDVDIEATKVKLEQLLRNRMIAERKEANLTPAQKTAILLHDATCTWNHTDGCSWHYEIKGGVHDWTGHAHSHALNSATKFLKFCGDRKVDPEVGAQIVRFANTHR